MEKNRSHIRLVHEEENNKKKETHRYMWIDISAVQQNGENKVVCRCILEEGNVRLEGNEQLISALEEDIRGYSGESVSPQDGAKFLTRVSLLFGRNGYMAVSSLKQGDRLPESL